MGIVQNQYLPPYAHGYSFRVCHHVTPFLPQHREIKWEVLDEPCLGLLESAHPDPYIQGHTSSASNLSINSSTEILPQHQTAQQLSDWLAQIFAEPSQPDWPLRSEAVTVCTQEEHHSTAHLILNLTGEVGSQADASANSECSREAQNFDGLPPGKWFHLCGNPLRLIHDPADTNTDALFRPGEDPVFDSLKAQLDISGIWGCAQLVGFAFADAAMRWLMAMRMAVQVRKYLWLLEEPTHAAGLATTIELPNNSLDFIFNL
jgi:hypothetical protein